MSLSEYRRALSTPGARGPVVASLFARLPIAMIGLALLLYVQRETGSYGPAGLVSAGALVGVAVGSVVQGRLMDRFGATRPMLVVVALYAGFVASGIAAVQAHAPVPLLVLLAVGIGMCEPQIGSASRAMWPRLLPAGPRREAALAYEAISLEVFFILGPGLAGVLAAAPWAGTGLVVGAVLMITGTVTFVLNPTIRGHRPIRDGASGPGLLGALASPGLRTVALAALGFGVVVGFIEVAVPAAATAAGHSAAGGLLLSLFSVTSVVFGVLYGVRPWPRPMHLRLPALLGGFAVLTALLAVPSGLAGLAVALLVVGCLITPQSTTHSAAIDQVAPAGAATEAFGWVITAVTLGMAGGQSVSGQLVTLSGPRLAFLVAAGAGVLLAAAVFAARRTVARSNPAPTPAPAPVAAHS
ncbi:MFS transporter [Actinocatenispora rupis]|uniref:MFS transporter n=1 Tax=Actinocatenispora rupis TaxID=519421 RepID=A0A8J3JAA7_9ACTN|nr:MFS transporter [Actinocatenispora rupis]GID11118.1 MFS transporter [Actinocatenispora rupis]